MITGPGHIAAIHVIPYMLSNANKIKSAADVFTGPH